MADNTNSWVTWNWEHKELIAELPKWELDEFWAIRLADRIANASIGILEGNWTSNIIPTWLIIKPKTVDEARSNINIIYETDYSDNLIPFVISTFRQLNLIFRIGGAEIFNYFEERKEEVKMLSYIYNNKYVNVFSNPLFSVKLYLEFEQILQPNYFEKQQQNEVDRQNRRILWNKLESLVWLTWEVFAEYSNKPNMLDELYKKMSEEWKLKDNESARISSLLSSSLPRAHWEVLFYMFCIEYKYREVAIRTKEWKINADEQDRIMKARPESAVRILNGMDI